MSEHRGPEFVYDDEPEAPGAVAAAGGARRRGQRGARPLRRLAAGAAVVVALGAGANWVREHLPSLNPFTTEKVERDRPSVLRALNDLSRYHAATGEYSVTVDVEDDVRFVPSAIAGSRTVFQAVGSVDAFVDFTGIGEGAIEVSPDGRGVTVRLPRAQLSEPRVDPERSFVVNRDRGLLDRLGGAISEDPGDDQKLYVLAEERLTAAASEDRALAERAEANTRATLEGMLRSLGYTEVTVVFEALPK